jgi:Protein of unknown function (DUF1579)
MSTASRPTLDRLDVFIGRWLTEGETVATPEAPSVKILASDVYEWGPGGRFIMHPAYGRIGEQDVGGLEVIGYDPATDQFRTYFFDHTGNVITETLTCRRRHLDVAGNATPLHRHLHRQRSNPDGAP